jgi:hypothetical protein
LGQASPHFQTLTQARAAAKIVWDVIDAVSRQYSLAYIKLFDYSISSFDSHRKLIAIPKPV